MTTTQQTAIDNVTATRNHHAEVITRVRAALNAPSTGEDMEHNPERVALRAEARAAATAVALADERLEAAFGIPARAQMANSDL